MLTAVQSVVSGNCLYRNFESEQFSCSGWQSHSLLRLHSVSLTVSLIVPLLQATWLEVQLPPTLCLPRYLIRCWDCTRKTLGHVDAYSDHLGLLGPESNIHTGGQRKFVVPKRDVNALQDGLHGIRDDSFGSFLHFLEQTRSSLPQHDNSINPSLGARTHTLRG